MAYPAPDGIRIVADVDAAIALGPGLRWAIMGPALTFHLAGGAGGMAHFLDHFSSFMAARWRELGQPELTSELARADCRRCGGGGRALGGRAGGRARRLPARHPGRARAAPGRALD